MNEPFFEPELAQRVNMMSIPTMAPDRTPDSSRSTTRPIARPFSTCIFPRPYSDPARHIMSSPEEVFFSDPRVDQHAPSISTATAGRYKTHRRRLSSASRSAVSVVRSCTSMSEEESKRRTASLFVGTPKFSSPITIPQGRVVGGGNEKVAVPDSTQTALRSSTSTDKEFILPLYDNGGRTRPRSPFLLPTASWRTALRASLACLIIVFGTYQYLVQGSLGYFSTHHDPGLFKQQEREFAKISQRCEALSGITTSTYLDRLSHLRDTLNDLRDHDENRRQIWISEPSASSSYFTSISSSEWFLSERPFLFMVESSGSDGSDVDLRILTPRFEEDRARILPLFGIPAHDLPENREMEMKKSMIETFIKGDKAYTIEYIAWAEDESPYAVLAEHLERTSGLERRKSESIQVHLDPGVRAFISSGLAHEFDSRRHGGVYLDLADHEVLSIRERKTAEELALLECANQYTLQAIRRTREKIQLGMTESDVSTLLKREFKAIGMDDGEGLVLFGENAALPHGSGTDKTLTDRDLVLIDAGGSFKGYVADVTRTFALEQTKLSQTQQRLWYLVQSAQQAALDAAVKQRSTGHSVDAAARDLIDKRGIWPEEKHGLTHRLGHGIGLEGHESPYLVGSNDDEIVSGNTFSNEPGIYIVGQVGIRLEDCWYLLEDDNGKRSARMFTGSAQSPFVL